MLKKLLCIIVFLQIVSTTLAEEVSMEVQWYPQAQFAGYIMALEKGFFSDNNLEVTLIFSDGIDQPLQKLKNGEIDFCSAWLSAALKNCEEDNKLVNIYQVLQKSSLMFVAKKKSNINKPKDLNGKRVGLWGGDFELQPNAFFRKYKIECKRVPQSYNIDGFLVGAWEVASAMYYNEYHKIFQAGVDEEDLVSFFFADHGLNFVEDGIYCRKQTYLKNKNMTMRFTNSIKKGWDYAFQNKEETLDILMQYCHRFAIRTNRAHQNWMLNKIEEAYKFSEKEGILQEEDYYRVVRELRRQGFIKNNHSYNDFFKGNSE